MARCLIGCGSNLGKRREHLDRALELLRFMPGVDVRAVSRYRETVPVGGPAQGAFLNGACLIETDLPPRAVLDLLAAVEHTLHRERHDRWGPRTIDLDLLLYDDVVMDTDELTVPHPRMATRRFVLEPAAEIARDLPYPTASCTVGDLLDNISTPNPSVAVVGVPGSGAAEVAEAVADAMLARMIHAPAPWPLTDGRPCAAVARWRQTLDAWSAPLLTAAADPDARGVVTDYWCGGLVAAAAAALDADEATRFRAEAHAVMERIPAPTVAILVTVDAATLEERIAFRCGGGRDHSTVFHDLQATAVLCDTRGDTVSRFLALQQRLVRSLRCAGERCPRAPKAVVVIAGDDLGGAAADAVAAVEAML